LPGEGRRRLPAHQPAERTLNRIAGRSEHHPGAVGTAGAYPSIFYWLEDNDDLKHHIGHRVEVVGSLKGDPKNAEIRLRRYYAWTEMKVKSDGHSTKVLVPAVLPAPYVDIDTKVSAVMRKVDVDYVFMLAVGC
jgi:hypothetical protein